MVGHARLACGEAGHWMSPIEPCTLRRFTILPDSELVLAKVASFRTLGRANEIGIGIRCSNLQSYGTPEQLASLGSPVAFFGTGEAYGGNRFQHQPDILLCYRIVL